MNLQDDLKKLSEKIRQYRDEARVQLHLAREDVKDEWDDLEKDWEKFRSRLDSVLHDTEDATQEARQTAKRLGEEVRAGYERIRDRLK
ncbi:hypothetical protein [Marinobacter sp.]|uniref:hypothetical protein n=1 Tax=Marinobacter sp. TaxID=50741 RepID=UPI0034A5BAF4